MSSFESFSLLVQKKKFEINFQDGGYGGHLGLSIGTTLGIVFIYATPILTIKFRVNLLFGSGEGLQNRFLR